MNTTTKCISFDLWDTIFKSNSSYKERKADIFVKHLGISQEEANQFLKATKKEATKHVEERGVQPKFDQDIMAFCKQKGIERTKQQIEVLLEELYMTFLKFPPTLIEEDVHDFLQELRNRGLKLCISSNTDQIPGRILQQVVHNAGLSSFFDKMYFSDEIRCSKPSVDFFAEVFPEHGPKEKLHVGDNYTTDYIGAKRSGLQPLLFRNQEHKRLSITSLKEISAKV